MDCLYGDVGVDSRVVIVRQEQVRNRRYKFFFSFYDNETREKICRFLLSANSVCVKSRCPDVLWLINVDYLPNESTNSIQGQKEIERKFNLLPQCTNACKCSRRNNRKKHAKQTKSETDLTGNGGAAQTTPTSQKHLVLSGIIFFIYTRKRIRANITRFLFVD